MKTTHAAWIGSRAGFRNAGTAAMSRRLTAMP